MPSLWCPSCSTALPEGAGFCSHCGSSVESAEARTQAVIYAGFGRRLAALLIDQVAILAAANYIGRPFGMTLAGWLYIGIGGGPKPSWEVAAVLGFVLVAALTSVAFEVVWVAGHL